jgi:integrase/recombinase XerC
MIRLMLDCGLRVGEVVGLDLEHAEDTAVWILGKGRTERERIGLPVQTAGAIRRWLEVRGDVAGPLFQGVTRHGKVRAGRLSTRSVRRMLEEHGEALGTAIRPHGLRHTAITAALDATNGDLRKCARFSRHANLATLERYDDNRRDVAADVAADLAGSW